MANIKRKEGENFESFLRRFKLYLQNSKKLIKAKEKRYLTPKENKQKRKQQALVSKKIRDKKEFLKKVGKLPEDENRR